ncbi:hypothetical protein HVX25_23825 (plasmid) [Escherichia coli]|uniref:hypothetical protein n=1 Tax=Escherichia coli TaxID=562 RepID=UPI0002A1CD39|nr:hypothetical protein [Escherichia coli]ECS2560910.1 hypothetical protein [Salmonella enterica subsp. enterica serovar Meleagridis]EFA5380286.1 hypothetical protein [Escherichia coli]EFA5389835.1 hypothetical protein [Escherichia coli]EFF8624731.1 hypothetical protein [Escherichia coli]EGU1107918.1 hypothetical protein [Escherichia coli]
MTRLSKIDFIKDIVVPYKAMPFLGYEVVFGLDGKSLLLVTPSVATPVFFTCNSNVLLNAAYKSFYEWLYEYNHEVEKSLYEDQQAEAAAERALTRMFEDSGWLEHEAQDAWEYKKARLDPQSGFYGDF